MHIKKLFITFLFFLFSASLCAETLTVYTYDSFASKWGPGPAIKKAFEEKYHCTLNYVVLDGASTILNRLRLEGNHNKADIILGLDTNSMYEAQKTGLVAEHHLNTTHLDIPNGWDNAFFIPFDYGYFSFVYDSEKLKNPPESMDELLDSNDLRVIYEDPRTSTPGLGLMLWFQSLYGKNADVAWKKLAQKTVVVTKGWSEAYSLFLKGEADLVLSYTTSPAYHIIAENENKYRATDFLEGAYMQVEVAAKTSTTKHNELANKFLQFVLSPAFQSQIPTGNWMYPVINIKLPDGYDQLSIPEKALRLSGKKVAKSRKKWIRNWRAAVSQ